MSEKMKEIFEKQQEQKEPKQDTEKITQLVGFMVGTEEFAVPILSIQEIIKPLEYTRVPSTPDYVMGVFNLRGTVIPLINLRLRFKVTPKKMDEETRFIVMKSGEDLAGFVIDRLTEAVRIKESNIDPTPDTLGADNQNMIYGVGRKDQKIITILNVDQLMKRTF